MFVDNYVVASISVGRGVFGDVKTGYKQEEPSLIEAVKINNVKRSPITSIRTLLSFSREN